MSQIPDTVTLTIDGRRITVPKSTLIIRAAEQLGTIVPRFCDHPLLDPVGACRQCIVEVEGQRKPIMACTTPVADGMEVRTHLTSDVARKGQEGTLEFLLINHPLDCPMCDKGGECPLQDQSLSHGTNVSRFIDEKRRYNKPVSISPQILLDRERCVLCARCTRFAEQIPGEPFIELFERSALEQVAIYEDEPYESYFSGNIIQICPVGALTSTSYRFKARPFDVRSAPSVCNHCSAGCTLTIQSRRGEIERQMARTNMEVNEAWSCDKGRFGYAHLTAGTRLTAPQVRQGGELVATTWAEALMRAVRGIQEAQQAGGDRVAVVTGSRVADEDAYAISRYTRAVLRTDDCDFRPGRPGTVTLDELSALHGRATATYADVEHAPVILTVGLDPREEVPILFLRLRKAWRDHKARIVPVGPRMGSLAGLAWRRLPTAPGGEVAALRTLLAGAAQPRGRVGGADGGDAGPYDTVGAALRDSEGVPVVLVGERAPAGALADAGRLADAVGGRVAFVPRRAGARGALDAGLAAGLLPGGRRIDDADDRAAVEDVWGALPDEPGRDLHAILADAAAGRIDVLHLIGVDLARDCPTPELAQRALSAAGTVIVQDMAENATTAHADVVLPVTGAQERAGSFTDWEGRTQPFSPAVGGPDLVQDDWEVVHQLSALLGHDLGFNDLAGLRADRDRLGVRESPQDWPETAEGGQSPPRGAGGTGLRLITYPLLLDRGTMLVGAHDLNATAPDPFVAVSTDDAGRLGIADGAPVEVSADGAGLTLPARLETDVVEGTVFVPANSTEHPAWQLAAAGEVSVRPAPDGGGLSAGGAEPQDRVGPADGGVGGEHARGASEGGDLS